MTDVTKPISASNPPESKGKRASTTATKDIKVSPSAKPAETERPATTPRILKSKTTDVGSNPK